MALFDLPPTLRGPQIGSIQFATATPPDPYTPKASILDRIAGRLFPAGPYEGLLGPGDLQDLQRQGLFNFGLNLLQQAGPSPVRVGLGQAVGNALHGVDFSGMADQALQLQNYRGQLAQQAKREQLLSTVPAAGGDLRAWVERTMPLFIGDPETLKALSDLHRSLVESKGPGLQHVEGKGPHGEAGTYLTDPYTGQPTGGFVPAAAPTTAPPGPDVLLAYAKNAQQAFAPYVAAKQSYDTYQATRAATGAVADRVRLTAALNVIVPGMHLTPDQLDDPSVAEGLKHVPVVGAILGAFQSTGELKPAERTAIDQQVQAAIDLRKTEASRLESEQRRLAPEGIDPNRYVNNPFTSRATSSTRPPLAF